MARHEGQEFGRIGPGNGIDPELWDAPCGFRFEPAGIICGASIDHPVHHGRWPLGEPNHAFVPTERRAGIDRRRSVRGDR